MFKFARIACNRVRCTRKGEHGSPSVSYTHLDVYQRQAEDFAKAGVAIASAFDGTNHLAFGSESGACELL